MKEISDSEFGQRASQLLEFVHETGETVRITKAGKPYAELVSTTAPKYSERKFGQFADQMKIVGDIIGSCEIESTKHA